MKSKVVVSVTFCLLTSLALSLLSQTETKKGTCKYWCPNREFDFSAIYYDNSGKVLTRETITIKTTGKIWDIDPKQTLVTFRTNFTSEDSMKLAPHALNGINRAWEKKYQEGVIEDSAHIWMHPIRQNQYLLTEIAPFPEVKFPLMKNRTWNSTLWIYEVFGSFRGTVNSTYSIEGIEARKYQCGTYKCWKIVGTATHDKLGESSVIIYFNEDLGFTEMDYSFYNKQKITFILYNFKM
ncbi:MAG: hypothetical protein IPI93_06065 [Sphingobacteriaceae bacterium]|nr:hypothetical protein [Sphingobacteriaceae bacterium]MBK7816326.1 hypothetical protein [Sphingobacteriaceae bacterium]